MKKSLTQQLEEAKLEFARMTGKYDAIYNQLSDLQYKNEQENKNNLNMFRKNQEELFSANAQLMEVVRWHINPETAKRPEREEFNRRIFK